jgi:nitrate/nitrite transport system substrate-binding protein
MAPEPGAIFCSGAGSARHGDREAAMSEATGGRETGIERAVERAVEHAVFGGARGRREFVRLVGAATASAALASVFPLAQAKALAQDKPGPIEKRDLKIGFIPITCATPIIMAEPMGFYKKHGLNVQVIKASSWAMIRDLSINGETDATHMLSPMPLAISLGVGSQSVPYVMPAVENINGQAITLANKHKGVKSAADFKGFKFAVPFDYSMHNFLLRYVVAEAGLDPDRGHPDPRGAAARDGGESPGREPGRLPRPRPLQPAGRPRGDRLHLDAVQGHLAGPPVLRIRGPPGARRDRAEYLRRALPRHRRRDPVRA